MSNTLVNIQYPGGSHGSFLRYFIDRFSKHTPNIDQSPFMANGTSHNKEIKYSDRIRRWGFDDSNGNYDFTLKYADEPHIFVLIDEPSILNFTRHVFLRPADHEWMPTHIRSDVDSGTVEVNTKFVDQYKDKFRSMYNLDIDEKSKLPFSIIRDFLKILFLNTNDNQWINTSKESRKKANAKTYFLNLSEIWHTDTFIERMKYISQQLSLDLDLGQEAIDLHKQFLAKRFNHSTWNRSNDIIEAILNNTNMSCTDLDLVEEAFINAWIEREYEFVMTPHTRYFFNDTHEICEYITNFPNHYKAMNPNLQTFNNKPNPFYLWSKK